MSTKLCLLFLLVVCIAGFGSAKPQSGFGSCGKNEVFKSCGSRCEPTCATRNDQIYCIHVCVARCQCQPGYLRNKKGTCVLPKDC
ncbi:chymotrypsin inhibitor-like [Zeugodacus cucurbitae]|uniref:chymotrypsin inhibitor-like n=1 Tax=Zeugodacus cucurbitae TaxID=28588 RepID=UPI0023D95C1E|nr:chymotrypsin inhibitor-like [Zeugodacus cucurbitae]